MNLIIFDIYIYIYMCVYIYRCPRFECAYYHPCSSSYLECDRGYRVPDRWGHQPWSEAGPTFVDADNSSEEPVVGKENPPGWHIIHIKNMSHIRPLGDLKVNLSLAVLSLILGWCFSKHGQREPVYWGSEYIHWCLYWVLFDIQFKGWVAYIAIPSKKKTLE